MFVEEGVGVEGDFVLNAGSVSSFYELLSCVEGFVGVVYVDYPVVDLNFKVCV